MLFFGNGLFGFTDESTYLESVNVVGRKKKLEGPSYRLVIVNQENYLSMKNNLGRYDKWMNTDHLALTSSWMMRNQQSKVTDAFDVICNDFVSILCNFYSFMMFNKGGIHIAQNAWTIHRFLSHCQNLLSK